MDRAVSLVRRVCVVAGSMSFLHEIDAEAREAGLVEAVARQHTALIFDWLISAFGFQGISDRVARDYMAKHGSVTWSSLQASLRRTPSCPKLRGYWTYEACRYDKGSFTCSEPEHIDHCPVPRPHLRNGRLNQTAYSLFLFVRDLADSDIVGWFDRQLETAAAASGADSETARQEALIGPLRNVYGVSDKVLTMALSTLLMGVRDRPVWFETGKSMIAIDTLVHNFLHRTGILHDCGTPHAYGAACYREGGCADIIRAISNQLEPPMSTDTDRIRMLNDELRKNLLGGGAVITPGIAALGAEAVERLVKTIAVFDDFCAANDPYEEHDFGEFDFDGVPVMFKIDYFDQELNFHSPDPADPAVTRRVITLMLSTEY